MSNTSSMGKLHFDKMIIYMYKIYTDTHTHTHTHSHTETNMIWIRGTNQAKTCAHQIFSSTCLERRREKSEEETTRNISGWTQEKKMIDVKFLSKHLFDVLIHLRNLG